MLDAATNEFPDIRLRNQLEREYLESTAKTRVIPHTKRYMPPLHIAGTRCSGSGFDCAKERGAAASTSSWSRTSRGDCGNCRVG